MLKISEILDPVEWSKSFIGDNLPDGPQSPLHTGYPVVKGQMYGELLQQLSDNYEEFGKVYTVRIMGFKWVILIGPEANREILVRNPDNFSWADGMMGNLDPLLGDGLLTTDGDTHDRARELLEPAFRKNRLKQYGQKMINISERRILELNTHEYFDIYDWVYDVAIENAFKCFLGKSLSKNVARNLKENFDRAMDFFGSPMYLQALKGPYTPYASLRKAKENIENILFNEIEQRQEQAGEAESVLDLMIAAGSNDKSFTREEIKDQLITLIWAGHDTTISTIAWLVALLCKNPEVYSKLQTEIDDKIDQSAPVETYLNDMTYLEMVMDETLRLYPPAWFGGRMNREPFKIHGERIPPRTQIAYVSLMTHRLPDIYPQPEAFRPDRFKPEKKRNLPQGAYVPFGGGPRTCLGMGFGKLEITIIVTLLLKNYDIELKPGETFDHQYIPTLSPRDGIEVKLLKRDSKITNFHNNTNNKPEQNESHAGTSDNESCPH